MAFNSANFHPVGPLGNPSIYPWTYSTSDNIATVTTSGYFNSLDGRGSIRVGDLITVETSNGNLLMYVQTVGTTGNGVTAEDLTSVLWP